MNCQAVCAVFRYSDFVRELRLCLRNNYRLTHFRIGCRVVSFATSNLHHLLVLCGKYIVCLERNGIEPVGFQFKRWRHEPVVCCTLRVIARLCASLKVICQSPLPCLAVVVGVYCGKVVERLLVVETFLERWRKRIADNDSIRNNAFALTVASLRCNNKAILLQFGGCERYGKACACNIGLHLRTVRHSFHVVFHVAYISSVLPLRYGSPCYDSRCTVVAELHPLYVGRNIVANPCFISGLGRRACTVGSGNKELCVAPRYGNFVIYLRACHCNAFLHSVVVGYNIVRKVARERLTVYLLAWRSEPYAPRSIAFIEHELEVFDACRSFGSCRIRRNSQCQHLRFGRHIANFVGTTRSKVYIIEHRLALLVYACPVECIGFLVYFATLLVIIAIRILHGNAGRTDKCLLSIGSIDRVQVAIECYSIERSLLADAESHILTLRPTDELTLHFGIVDDSPLQVRAAFVPKHAVDFACIAVLCRFHGAQRQPVFAQIVVRQLFPRVYIVGVMMYYDPTFRVCQKV